MDGSSTLRYALITFRPHAGNPTALTDFLTIFLPRLSKVQNYAHSNEEVGTPSQHFHAIVSGNFKDSSKITQWIMSKAMKDFKTSLKPTQTIWEHALDIKLLPQDHEDMLRVLGYVLKSEKLEDKKTQKIKGFTNEQCLEGTKLHFTSAKHKSMTAVIKNDWIILTKKNAHSIIENYCEKNNKTIRDEDLEYSMYKSGYSFADLTSRAQLQISYEILSRDPNLTEIEEEIIKNHIKQKQLDGKIDGNDPHPCDEAFYVSKHEAQLKAQREWHIKVLQDIANGSPISKYVYPDGSIIPERYIKQVTP